LLPTKSPSCFSASPSVALLSRSNLSPAINDHILWHRVDKSGSVQPQNFTLTTRGHVPMRVHLPKARPHANSLFQHLNASNAHTWAYTPTRYRRLPPYAYMSTHLHHSMPRCVHSSIHPRSQVRIHACTPSCLDNCTPTRLHAYTLAIHKFTSPYFHTSILTPYTPARLQDSIRSRLHALEHNQAGREKPMYRDGGQDSRHKVGWWARAKSRATGRGR
jgi:hypothetical protein